MSYLFSCDWGTSSFRLRFVNAETGQVLAERRASVGAKAFFTNSPDDAAARGQAFSDFLRGHMQELAASQMADIGEPPVIISGMASSSIGWRELPYARTPTSLDGAEFVQQEFPLRINERWQARTCLVSGVRTDSDIMRGEETQIVGLFAGGRYPQIADEGLVVLPGTHSKHVRLQNERLLGFHTHMTGELFDILSVHSILSASVRTPAGAVPLELDDRAARGAFVAGTCAATGLGLARSLFQTRVRTILQHIPENVNRWFLSGLLVGAEAADLARRSPKLPILLGAPESLAAAYKLAFETAGLSERTTVVSPGEVDLASVRGHCALWQRVRKA
jgi:2-dehydro-3-deoxygalactonokinase